MYGRRMCDVLHGRVVTRGGAGTGGLLVVGDAGGGEGLWEIGRLGMQMGKGNWEASSIMRMGDGVRQLEPMHARTAALALLFVPSPCPGGAGCMFPIPPANAPPSE